MESSEQRLENLRKLMGKPSKMAPIPDTSSQPINNGKDLNELRKLMGKPIKVESEMPSGDEDSYGKTALQGIRGFAEGAGRSIDAATGLNNPNMATQLMEKALENAMEEGNIKNVPYKGLNKSIVPQGLGQVLPEAVENIAGRNLKPAKDDLGGNIAHGTGEFASSVLIPGSGIGKALQTGIKSAAKLLAKEGVASAGAATALHAKPKFTEEGSIGRGVEDFIDSLIGGRAATKLTNKSAKAASNLYKTTAEGNLLKGIKEAPIKSAARFFSGFSDPDLRTFLLAKKHNIDLPVNVGLNNTPLNSLHNNFLKSMFSSKTYRDVYKKADEQMFNKMKSSIDSLGVEDVPPTTASAGFRDFLKEEKKIIRDKSEKMYSDAVIKEGKKELITPVNTKAMINKFSDLLDYDIRAPETLKVSKVLGELADKWELLPRNNKMMQELRKAGYEDPELLSKIFSQISKSKNNIPSITLERLDNVRKELGKMTYDKDLRGPEGLLSKLRDAVTKDIETSQNPKFIQEWKNANRYYRENVALRVQSDLAHSMLTGEVPKEAFDVMNTVKGVEMVEKIAGQTEKGKRAFDDLKKAKVRDVLKNVIEGNYEDGSIRKGAFANMFQKGEKRQELLLKLLGNKEYNNLADIAHISSEFSKSGKELLGTSGTAFATADIDRVQSIAKQTLKLLFVGGAGYSTAGIAGGAAGIASPYLLSKLVSNPTFVREARIYALAKKAGREKHADSVLKRLIKMSDSEARRSSVLINKELSDKEDEQSE